MEELLKRIATKEEAIQLLIETEKQRQHADYELRQAVAMLKECEVTFGCECPYCDKNYGDHFDEHADCCAINRFLKKHTQI